MSGYCCTCTWIEQTCPRYPHYMKGAEGLSTLSHRPYCTPPSLPSLQSPIEDRNNNDYATHTSQSPARGEKERKRREERDPVISPLPQKRTVPFLPSHPSTPPPPPPPSSYLSSPFEDIIWEKTDRPERGPGMNGDGRKVYVVRVVQGRRGDGQISCENVGRY